MKQTHDRLWRPTVFYLMIYMGDGYSQLNDSLKLR